MQYTEFTSWFESKALLLLKQSIATLNNTIDQQTQIHKKEHIKNITNDLPNEYLEFQVTRCLESFKSNLLCELQQATCKRKFFTQDKYPVDMPIRLYSKRTTLLEKAKLFAMAHTLENLPQLAFLDLETDGVNVQTTNILQVAIVKPIIHSKHDSLHQYKTWSSYIMPYLNYNEKDNGAFHINHIGDKELCSGPLMEDAAEYISELLKDTVIVGYNVNNFDIPILKRHLNAYEHPLHHKFSIDLYPACWKNKKQKLNDATLAYNLQSNPNPHDALADANCCVDLLSELIERNELPNNEEDLLDLFNSPNNIWQHFNKYKIIQVNEDHQSYSHLLYNTPPTTQQLKRDHSYINTIDKQTNKKPKWL
jgi:DNA polymerase III epsilon subunit-like protein